jgi:SOS-response transcriptional repressor LexA
VLGPSKVKLPEWAHRIAKLRDSLQITQTSLAERLKVTPMSVSRWERGTQEPSSEILILLGNMSGEPDNWYFWRAAGLSPKAISGLKMQARGPQRLFSGPGSPPKLGRKTLVPVSLLNVSVGAESAGSKQIAGEVEAVLSAPRAWCPNPASTVCIHVSGDTMAPAIMSGSIVAVDTSQTDAAALRNTYVIAQHASSGLFIGRLSGSDGVPALLPENAQYPSIPFSNGWKIAGKVLWWISFPR